MARKKKHPEHVNHERWLISYADFITLLFAFFVVMFAVSRTDSAKVGRFTESFSKAVGIDMFPAPGKGMIGGGPSLVDDSPPAASEELPPEVRTVRDDIAKLESRHQLPSGIQVFQRGQEIVVRLSAGVLYDPGDDVLRPEAKDAIHILARRLAPRAVDLRVEGHTDNRPIHTDRFRSNWDLSTSRATAVVAALSADGFAPARLSAAGYGEFHPMSGNDTDEGRTQNRRVDIVITASRTSKKAEKNESEPRKSEPHAENDTAEKKRETK